MWYRGSLCPEDYTVGLICALPEELTAIRLALDDVHPEPPLTFEDETVYIFGSTAGHNVVVGWLPAGRYGNNSAAVTATKMRLNFKSIRFALLVGVGGGVPSPEADIRLADVIVSQPRLQNGSVIQYDLGKVRNMGAVERTGYLQPPPAFLLNATLKLQSDHSMGFKHYHDFLRAICNTHNCSRPISEMDILFEASSKHVGSTDCKQCLEECHVTHREPQLDYQPVVHYGTIASGNTLMRNGVARDKINSDLGGVLCFDMESAALMNIFPSLIIRGISDYADSHKDKKWQPYAAAAAAAYAKEPLSVIPHVD